MPQTLVLGVSARTSFARRKQMTGVTLDTSICTEVETSACEAAVFLIHRGISVRTFLSDQYGRSSDLARCRYCTTFLPTVASLSSTAGTQKLLVQLL